MIEELLHFGEMNNLTGRESVEIRPIPWVVDLAHDGQVLKVSPTIQATNKRGKRYSTPRNYHLQVVGSEAKSVGKNQGGWLPSFLFGRLSDYVLMDSSEEGSQEKKRLELTHKLIEKASSEMPEHEGLRAVLAFVSASKGLGSLGLTKEDESASEYKRLLAGQEQLTFRYNSNLLIYDVILQKWWRNQFQYQRDLVLDVLPKGRDLVSGEPTGIPEYHPVITGKTSLISTDKAPFSSYGLGKCTASMGIGTSETISAALSFLWKSRDNYISWGDVRTIFWADVDKGGCAVDFVSLIEAPDSLSVRDFMNSVWGSAAKTMPNARFNLAMFTENPGRIIPIYWNSKPLSEVENNLISYFRRIGLPWHPKFSNSPDYPECHDDFPPRIGLIAKSLVKKSPEVSPPAESYSMLMATALFGNPLPHKLFGATLNRQTVEVTKGPAGKSTLYEIGPFEFEKRLRARTALVKLYFESNRKGGQITMENHPHQDDSAYLCGRLLALLDKIHNDAHRESGGTNSSPANRAYAAASTTPALIFPQLCKLTRYHLNKVGGGWANCLEHGYEAETGEFIEGLKQVVTRLQDTTDGSFPRTLSLEQQGRFAIGFYYERCRRWPLSKKKADAADETHQEEESDSSIVE